MWSPALTLSISLELTDPNPSDFLEPEFAHPLLNNKSKHDCTARDWEQKSATCVVCNLQCLPAVLQVATGHGWEGMWPFLDLWDVGEMRTTGSSWNIPSKYGPHGELFFFLLEKEPMFYGEVVDFGRSAPSETEDGESFSGEG